MHKKIKQIIQEETRRALHEAHQFDENVDAIITDLRQLADRIETQRRKGEVPTYNDVTFKRTLQGMTEKLNDITAFWRRRTNS